ncbi:hypothetical protein [Streptomyces sp. DASNCL29]|uniref:hypothetical protein n=1 Tax=Streptomyces sp. DASNCL29 TaxID=2583819 RepID=UPI001F0E3153|nr:hypothetical protein [Streptomyces sp. DASNCL29]
MGAIDVPADRYWGARTQRSLIHFSIGDDRLPKAVYHAYGHVNIGAVLERHLPHLASGDVTAEDFDRIADPAAMVGPAEGRG